MKINRITKYVSTLLIIVTPVTFAEKVDFQEKLNTFKITVSGKQTPEKIPNARAMRQAIIEMNVMERIKKQKSSSQSAVNSGSKNPAIVGLTNNHKSEFNRADEKAFTKSFKLVCNEINRQQNNGSRDGYALSESILQFENGQSAFIERYYDDLLAKVPKQKAEQLSKRVESLKRKMTYSYHDYEKIATHDPELLFALFESSCERLITDTHHNF